MTEPMSVLFICTANICRSAYADRRAPMVVDSLTYVSAGTQGWEAAPMERRMASELTLRGGDPTGFASQRVTIPMVTAADLVLVAESRHRTWILEDVPSAHAKTFTFGLFERAVLGAPPEMTGRDLVTWAAQQRLRIERTDDIPDPYHRGPEAAAATAARIDRSLHVILPRLV